MLCLRRERPLLSLPRVVVALPSHQRVSKSNEAPTVAFRSRIVRSLCVLVSVMATVLATTAMSASASTVDFVCYLAPGASCNNNTAGEYTSDASAHKFTQTAVVYPSSSYDFAYTFPPIEYDVAAGDSNSSAALYSQLGYPTLATPGYAYIVNGSNLNAHTLDGYGWY